MMPASTRKRTGLEMNVATAEPAFATSDSAPRGAVAGVDDVRAPLCFVVDADGSIRNFLSLVLHGAGIDTEEFADSRSFRAAIAQRAPALVFLNIALESAEAIECVAALGNKGFGGYVQLMSSRGSAVLEHVKGIGAKQRLQMLAPLKKPFETSAVLRILNELQLGHPPAQAARIDLDEALRHDWIEFWYQPRIDLRKKQLVGLEAFARARHPQLGVLMPGAFMLGASESSLISLSEQALAGPQAFHQALGDRPRWPARTPLSGSSAGRQCVQASRRG
jgi:FixJ family two-component response regulator